MGFRIRSIIKLYPSLNLGNEEIIGQDLSVTHTMRHCFGVSNVENLDVG